MRLKGFSMKYYSLKPILKRKATYNVIIGERSNGKTYACLKLALDNYFKDGSQFAYIRRWSVDVRPQKMGGLFAALINDGYLQKVSNGRYSTIVFKTGKFFLANFNDEGKAIYSDTDVLGFAISLNDSEHIKSVSYPLVNLIVFDEFLTNQLYLENEFILFMNVVSTIVRQRTNVKIFLLGNTVNRYSPYFKEMGLTNVLKMKQGTIDLYTYGDSKLTVAVEYCSSLEKSKKNNFYFAFDNPKLKMITGGAWELDIYPHKPVNFTKNDVKFIYFIEFGDAVYQCEIVFLPDQTFTFIHKKTTPIKPYSKVYSLIPNPSYFYSTSINRPKNDLEQKIYWYFVHDKVFYQDNDVGNAIANYLKNC